MSSFAAPDIRVRVSELLGGWRTLLGATLGSSVGVHALPFYTSGIFLVALQQDLGWSRSAISLGTTFLALGLGIAAPFVGALCDRFGETRIIVPGLIVQITALAALSTVHAIIPFYLLMGGMALFGAGCASLPYARIVNRRFDASKGTALGLMIVGTAACSAMAPPLVQALIADHGWRVGYIALALVVVTVAPIGLILLGTASSRREPARPETAIVLPYARLAKDRTFLLLLAAILLVALAVPGIITHLAAMLIDQGVSAEKAAWMIAAVGMTQTAARLGTGLLVDRFFAPRVATVIFGICATCFLLFAFGGAEWALVGAIGAGLAYGAESDLIGYFVGRYFGAEHFGQVFGIMYAAFLAGNAASPLWYGWASDYAGDYRIALVGAAVAIAASACLFVFLPAFPREHEEPA